MWKGQHKVQESDSLAVEPILAVPQQMLLLNSTVVQNYVVIDSGGPV